MPLDVKMPRPNKGPRSLCRYVGFPRSSDVLRLNSFTKTGSVTYRCCMLPDEYVKIGPAVIHSDVRCLIFTHTRTDTHRTTVLSVSEDYTLTVQETTVVI